MTEHHKPIQEHLRSASLYEAGASSPAGSAWRRRLLDLHFPRARRSRPAAGLHPVMRLILIVAAPLAVITGIAIASYLGIGVPSGWFETLPRLEFAGLSSGGAAEWTDWAYLDRLGLLKHLFWPVLVFLSALFTFMIRGRTPRVLPMDW